MTFEMILAAVTLGAVLICCVRDVIPAHLAAMAGFAFLVAMGIIDQNAMLSVFSSSAPFTIVCMFILAAAIERSGLMHRAIQFIERQAQDKPRTALGGLYGTTAFLSGFVNNTPVVLMIAPLLTRLGKQIRIPASKLLIPLSYAAILGGSCTLIGTSTNLLVDGIAQAQGLEPFTMFELSPAGLSILAAGVIFMLVAGQFILPIRRPLREDVDEARANARFYMTDIAISPASSYIGQTLNQLEIAKKLQAEIVDLIRTEIPAAAVKEEEPATVRALLWALIQKRPAVKKDLVPASEVEEKAGTSAIHDLELREGDRLVFRATREQIQELRDFFKDNEATPSSVEVPELVLADILITNTSRHIGQKISEIWSLSLYGLEAIALHRKGRDIGGDLSNVELQSGDVLIVEGPEESINRFLKNENLVRADSDPEGMPAWRMLVSAGSLLGVIVLSALSIMPIASAALVAAVIVLLTRCLKLKDAYRAIQWPILMLIYGMLGISLALESTGAARMVVDGMIGMIGSAHPIVILSCFYLLTSVLTEIMSNNAAAVILTPLAIGIAQSLGLDPRPFVAAVMLGASASFATPMGYQTNTYVYGIGNYRFSDFLKVGIPMNIIAWAVATFVIPIIWPL